MKKVSLSQAYAGINRQFLALQVENEQLKARIKELEAQVASQQSVYLTVLPVREIETVCPHCSLVFDVPVPEPHSK